MKSPQFNPVELVLVVLFAGVWTGPAPRIWDGFFGVHTAVGSAILLLPTYLVAVLMIRRYRKGGP